MLIASKILAGDIILQRRIDDFQIGDKRVGVVAGERQAPQVRPARFQVERVLCLLALEYAPGHVLFDESHQVDEVGGGAEDRLAFGAIAVVLASEQVGKAGYGLEMILDLRAGIAGARARERAVIGVYRRNDRMR